jgi:hypothetical protein
LRLPLSFFLLKENLFLFKEVDFWRRKILFSLRKLIFKKVGWGYHLIAFSLGKLLPQGINLKKLPIINHAHGQLWLIFFMRIFKGENKVQANKFGYFDGTHDKKLLMPNFLKWWALFTS